MLLFLKLFLNGSLLFIVATASFYNHDDNDYDYEKYGTFKTYPRNHGLGNWYVEDDPLDENDSEPKSQCIIKPSAQNVNDSDWGPEGTYYRLIRNLRHVVPLHYDLELTIPETSDFITVSGKSRIKLEIFKSTQVIVFHYYKSQDIEMKLSDEKLDEVCISEYLYHPLLNAVKIFFDSTLQPGLYTLEIKFITKLVETTSVEEMPFIEHDLRQSVATTYLQPFAAQLFPCFDEPAFKTTFNITVNHGTYIRILTNMPFRKFLTWKNNDNMQFMQQARFYRTPRIPVHRVVFVIIPNDYTISSNNERSYQIWFRPFGREDIEYAETIIEKITPKFDWKRTFKLQYISHVVLPYAEKRYGHLGICTYTEGEIYYRGHLDPVARKIEVARAIGHAVADQWLTDKISPLWWTSLWLNKGITEFLSLDVLNKTFPEWRMADLFVVQTQHESLHLDTANIMKPLISDITTQSDIKSLFSFPFYMKAPIIIRMLKHILPDGVFQTYIDSLIDNRRPKLLGTNPFWYFLESTLDEMKLNILLNADRKNNVKQIMESWTMLKHYPVVNVERNYETGEIKLSQQHFQEEDVNSVGTWWIPITIAKQTDVNFINTEPLIWLNPSNKQYTINSINENGWIILNPQQSGYYRVNYDTCNWMLIADYLNSDNYTKIHVLNRAQIIDDAYHLLVMDQLDHKIFLKLMGYLVRETDYIAWYPMFKIFEYFSSFLPYAESIYLQEHMLRILNALLANIGYEDIDEDDDLTKSLRQEAAKWACTLGSTICMKKANDMLEEHLKSSAGDCYRGERCWKDWMYRKGLINADMDTWLKTIYHLSDQENYEGTIEMFSCSENPAIINLTVKKIFSKNATKRKRIIYEKPLKVISSIFAKHARNMLQDILEHLKGHSDDVVTKILAVTIYHLYNIDHLEKVNEFSQSNLKDKEAVANIQHLIKIRLPQMKDRIVKFRKWFKLKEIKTEKDITITNRILKKISKSDVTISRNILLDNILPLHYNIKLIIPKYIEEANFTFGGECDIKIVIHRATQKIGLHSLEQKIHKASLTRIKHIASRSPDHEQIYYCTKFAHDSINQILLLNFEVILLPGYYILNVKFESSLSDNGNGVSKPVYINGNGTRIWLFTTHSQPIRARQVFPCWDKPTLKSTFNISINHDPKYRPMSNMPIDKVHMENGRVWTHFDITPTMTTYQMAMAITMKDLYRISNIKRSINMWCRVFVVPHMSFAYIVAETVMQDLVRYTGTLKIPKMDYLTIPEIQEETIGNWGLNIYKENAIIYDAKLDTIAHKIDTARLVARAVAHQLLNNVTNPSCWSYPWLNEGLPMLLGTYAIDKNFICPRAMDLFVVQLQHESLHLDSYYNMQPLTLGNSSDIQSLFSFPFYVKAPVIVRMLQHIISNILFVQSEISTSFEIKQLKILTPYDICDAMETALNELSARNNYYTLKDVMDTWTTQSNYPVLNVIRDYSNGHVMISQEHFSLSFNHSQKSHDQQKWCIPVTYATRAKPYFSNILSIHWLEPHSQKNLILNGIDENTGWIIVNLQQTGYYRVNYDRMNWILISDYLNSKEYENIHVLNRAQIIDDAYHLLMANRLDYEIFLDLTEYLSQETDYIAWYPMIKVLEYLSSFLPFKESEFIKDHMVKILRGLLAKIGYDEYPKENNFIKCLRQEAVKWACTLGDINCKLMAKQKLEEHLTNPTENKLLPGWKYWTYCTGLKVANSHTWYKAWDTLYMNKSDNKALELLSCSETSTIISDILEIMLSETRNNKRSNAIYSLIAMHAQNNLDDILMQLHKYNVQDISKTLIIIINHVYSEDQLIKINEFIENYAKTKETIENIQYIIEERLIQIKYYTSKFLNIFTKENINTKY